MGVLENNSLESLPENIFVRLPLEILDLSNNQLEELPPSIGDSLFLKKIYLN